MYWELKCQKECNYANSRSEIEYGVEDLLSREEIDLDHVGQIGLNHNYVARLIQIQIIEGKNDLNTVHHGPHLRHRARHEDLDCKIC